MVGDQGKWWERRAVTLGDERYARWSMRTLPALPALPAGTALLSTFVYDCCPVCCVDKHPLNSVYLLRALWKNDCSFGSLRQGPIFIWDDILCPWVFDPGLHRNATEVAELHRRSWERKLPLLAAWVRDHLSSPVRQACWEACSAFLCVSLYFFPRGSLCLCLITPPEPGFSFWF